MTRGLTIGRLADAAGVNLETIRYYERIGLMPVPVRSRGGHRLYDESGEKRLSFIRRARDLGFPIEDIRALLALNDAQGPCAEVKSVASVHLAAVEAKIADLQRLRDILADTVAKCPGDSTRNCAVLDMLRE